MGQRAGLFFLGIRRVYVSSVDFNFIQPTVSHSLKASFFKFHVAYLSQVVLVD